jgi:hypothetical protein
MYFGWHDSRVPGVSGAKKKIIGPYIKVVCPTECHFEFDCLSTAFTRPQMFLIILIECILLCVYIKICRKWPSNNKARIGSKQVHNIVPCFYSKMLLHVLAFLIGHHQACIKVLKTQLMNCMYPLQYGSILFALILLLNYVIKIVITKCPRLI